MENDDNDDDDDVDNDDDDDDVTMMTKQLKNARYHSIPPPLHLSDIRCKCFPYRRCQDKRKDAVNEQTNEGVYVRCWKMCIELYNSHMNKKCS